MLPGPTRKRLKVPGAEFFEGLVAALLCATIGSVFAAIDAALGSLNQARLSALHEESKGLVKALLHAYLGNPSRAHSQWLVGRVVFTALAAVLIASQLEPLVPHWTLAPLGALGALLTYGTLAEVGTTLGRGRADYFTTRILPFLRPLELLVLPFASPLSILGRMAS